VPHALRILTRFRVATDMAANDELERPGTCV
jgi:hypothetical protein